MNQVIYCKFISHALVKEFINLTLLIHKKLGHSRLDSLIRGTYATEQHPVSFCVILQYTVQSDINESSAGVNRGSLVKQAVTKKVNIGL